MDHTLFRLPGRCQAAADRPDYKVYEEIMALCEWLLYLSDTFSEVHWLLQHQHCDVVGEAARLVVGVDEHPGHGCLVSNVFCILL